MTLTEIGTAEMSVVPLIVTLGRFIVKHDVLHEPSFHKQDVIYKLMHGSFLQPKGLNGDPMKRGVQKYENMLFLVALAARRHRFTRFFKQWKVNSAINRLTNIEILLHADKAYLSYCTAQEESNDEPTRIKALFLKYMDGISEAFML